MNFTLDQITMLALALVVGVVIDDAIVVLENIFRFMEEKQLSPFEAALQGTKDIGLAVLATTLSLVIIFLPVAMMPGIVGRFMSSFGYTAAFAIMVSLIVSFTLTPTLCSRYLKLRKDDKPGHTSKDTFLFRIIDRPYQALLRWSMEHRWIIVTVSVAVCLSVVPLFMMVGMDFLPQEDQSQFEVTVRMPKGSSLEGTNAEMVKLERVLRQLHGVSKLTTKIGADQQKQVDRGSILVDLVPIDQRNQSAAELMGMARERLSKFKDLTVGVQLPALISGGGSTSDFQFYVQGPDLAQLEKYSASVVSELKKLPGVVDLDSTYEAGKPELSVSINRDKASDLNVRVASVATALRTLVGGDEQATTYREGDDRYDVMLRVKKEFRDSPQALERLYVPSAMLGNVPLASVAAVRRLHGASEHPTLQPAAADHDHRQPYRRSVAR